MVSILAPAAAALTPPDFSPLTSTTLRRDNDIVVVVNELTINFMTWDRRQFA
jgi:hypothetical protein